MDSPVPKSVKVMSKKRKAIGIATSLPRKRVKNYYNDKYRELYNSVVADHFHSSSVGHSQHLKTSQIGSSVWTEAEKIAFFHLLARKGRHDIKAISTGLGSKSQPEIGQYMELLHKGLVGAELSPQRPSFLYKPDFEAACEVGPECMDSLDRAGYALSVLQQEKDEKDEQKRQGRLWLLTPRIGDWVDRRLRGENCDENEVSQLVPEAILLNLKSFLWLSKRFFMNSIDMEYNWSSYAEKSEEPAILRTAFTDFHTLTLSTMKRLIQSTLHFAISRLRAEKRLNERRKRIVTPQDVETALNVFDMRVSMKSYWSGVPRRCNLRVYEDQRTTHIFGKSYSHDEVEELLASYQRAENEEELLQGTGDGETTEDRNSASSDIPLLSDANSELDDAVISEPCASSSPSELDGETFSEEEERDHHCDEIMERLDQRKSQVEETRLWELLDENVVLKQDVADRNSSCESLVARRKDKAELVDWTSRIDYGAEWERLASPVPAAFFSQSRAAGGGSQGDKHAFIRPVSHSA